MKRAIRLILHLKFVRWDRGCSAADLNPADSAFEQKTRQEWFEEAGLFCSAGRCCTTFLRFHDFSQKTCTEHLRLLQWFKSSV